MSEHPPVHPPAVPGAPQDEFRPEYGWFAGIAEGAVADPDEISAAVVQLNSHGLLPDGRNLAELEMDRARYSIWFREAVIPGSELPADLHHAILAPMQRVAAATAGEGMESTVRWTLLQGEQVAECLLAPVGRGVPQIRAVQRQRPAEPLDRAKLDRAKLDREEAAPLRRRLLMVSGLVLVVLAAIALRMQHRWGAVDTGDLVLDPGALTGQIEARWAPDSFPDSGVYRVHLLPVVDAANAPPAMDLLLTSAAGEVLGQKRVDWPGASSSEQSVTVELPIHRDAHTVRLVPAVVAGGRR